MNATEAVPQGTGQSDEGQRRNPRGVIAVRGIQRIAIASAS